MFANTGLLTIKLENLMSWLFVLIGILTLGVLTDQKMVLLHFLVFADLKYKENITFLVYAAFGVALLEIFTPFMIIGGFEFFAYIKLFSFFTFLALLLYISWLLFKSITYR